MATEGKKTENMKYKYWDRTKDNTVLNLDRTNLRQGCSSMHSQ